jgi:hypothetical protein
MKIVPRFLPLTLTIVASLALSAQANAADLTSFNALSQTEFLALSKDLAASTSTKAMEPAAPLGISGFDVSGSVALTNTQAGGAWSKVSGDSMDQLTQTKLSVSKGLSGGWDVGGFVSKVSSTNVSATGVHVKYALLEGNAITPAIALRGSHSRMGGVSGMTLNNTGLDVLISKGFVGFTPYVGLGTVYSMAKATGKSDESFSQAKSFVGVSWNILLVNLSAEYDRTGKNSSVGFKAGARF